MKIILSLLIATKNILTLGIAVLCSGLVVWHSSGSVVAQVVRPDDRQSIIDETTFYDLVPLGNCGGGQGSFSLTGDNPKDAFNYFISKGLDKVQAAGIIGNLMQESGVNPKSNQADGPGRGIAQWSEGARWEDLKKWAAARNLTDWPGTRDPEDLLTQLGFLWHEMTEVDTYKPTLPALKLTTSIDNIYARGDPNLGVQSYGSTQTFEMKFEKADVTKVNMPNRVKQAGIALEKYGGPSPTASNTSASGASCGSGLLVNGYAFPLAPQTQRNYTNLPCKGGATRYTSTYDITTSVVTCHHDDTPAADLMYGGVDNQPIYAITDGKIIKVNRSYVMPGNENKQGQACNSIQFQANNSTDKSFYWYGHILADSGLKAGQTVKAGQPLGIVAPNKPYGTRCWGGGPHLHIDRGCHDKNMQWYQGGGKSCRDPQFMEDLLQIWKALPPA